MANSGLKLARNIDQRPLPRHKALGASLPPVRLAPPPVPDDSIDMKQLNGLVLLGYLGLIVGAAIFVKSAPASAPLCLGAGLAVAGLVYFVYVVAGFLVSKGALGWLALVIISAGMGMLAYNDQASALLRASAAALAAWPLLLGIGFTARAVGAQAPRAFGVIPFGVVALIAFVAAASMH